MNHLLEVKNLFKKYGDLVAVNNISFHVEKGELYAFLGQNGAGKSTTIKMIITLLNKDNGTISMNGIEEESYIRSKIGVVFQDNVLDPLLSVKENLLVRGSMYISNKEALLKRYNELMELLQFESFENQKFKTLSGGQKRRIEIARSLFSNPELLILDEPTTGLDPETRGMVWQTIENLRKNHGITVFLTTHYMEEARNADHVIIIHKGNIVAKGTPGELKNKYSKDYFRVIPKNALELKKYLDLNNRQYNLVADQFNIEINSTKDNLDLINQIQDNIFSFEVQKGTLDDVFINVVGEQK